MNEPYLNPTLSELVPQIEYKPNWRIYLGYNQEPDGSGGWHLYIISDTVDSLDPGGVIRVRHGFLVPAASYNEESWTTWVFYRCVDVERHEAGEFFRVRGERVFAPHHGNGEDPYITWHHGTEEARAKRAGQD